MKKTIHVLECTECRKPVEIKTAEEAKGIRCESCGCRLFVYMHSVTREVENV